MKTAHISAAALCAALSFPVLADEADLAARLSKLEARLAEQQDSKKGFNPDIALILSGGYTRLSKDPENWRLQGFMPAGEETGPGARGFTLGESEITLSANVDHYFRGALTFALTPENEAEIEEAKLETLALGHGLKLKAGRFLSGLGYLNEQHSHAWDFRDAPLAYQAFYGGQYKNDGVQLRWLAPTSQFLEFGTELGTGSNYPGTERKHNGIGAATAFVRWGDDLGADSSWLFGSWMQHTRADARTFEDTDSTGTSVSNAFSGRSRTWGINALFKQQIDTVQRFKLQGEYLQRRESGSLSYDIDNASQGAASGDYRNRQSGWYLQSVYQFHPQWRTGLRQEQLDSGKVQIGLVNTGTLTSADFSALQSYRPRKSSAMLEFVPSEFSSIRLQLATEKTQAGGSDHQIGLYYTLSLGTHGAHSY